MRSSAFTEIASWRGDENTIGRLYHRDEISLLEPETLPHLGWERNLAFSLNSDESSFSHRKSSESHTFLQV